MSTKAKVICAIVGAWIVILALVSMFDDDVVTGTPPEVVVPVDLDVAWNYATSSQQGALCSYAHDVGTTAAGAYVASYSATITAEQGKTMLLENCW